MISAAGDGVACRGGTSGAVGRGSAIGRRRRVSITNLLSVGLWDGLHGDGSQVAVTRGRPACRQLDADDLLGAWQLEGTPRGVGQTELLCFGGESAVEGV